MRRIKEFEESAQRRCNPQTKYQLNWYMMQNQEEVQVLDKLKWQRLV